MLTLLQEYCRRNVLREIKAALKSSAGTGLVPQGASYNRQEESPPFENLFGEEKNPFCYL